MNAHCVNPNGKPIHSTGVQELALGLVLLQGQHRSVIISARAHVPTATAKI